MRTLNRTRALSLGAALVTLWVWAPVAAAATPGPETITMHWSTQYVTSAPWVGSGTGTFSASGPSINETGSVSVAFHLGGAPAPSILNLHSDRVLSDASGNTITLRCNEIAFDFSNPAAVPVAGNCTVIGGTGEFAGLLGQGAMSGTGDTSGPTTAFLSELLQLSTP